MSHVWSNMAVDFDVGVCLVDDFVSGECDVHMQSVFGVEGAAFEASNAGVASEAFFCVVWPCKAFAN